MKTFFRINLALLIVLLASIMALCQTGFTAEWRHTGNGATFCYIYNCEEGISLLECPSTDAPVLGYIPLGARVTCSSDYNDEFVKVHYQKLTGYVLGEFLTTDYLAYQVVNCNEWISLRAEPSSDSGALCTIPLGEWVRYIEDAGNGFFHVAYKRYHGYALAKYLE